jgi:hypothetical protein
MHGGDPLGGIQLRVVEFVGEDQLVSGGDGSVGGTRQDRPEKGEAQQRAI